MLKQYGSSKDTQDQCNLPLRAAPQQPVGRALSTRPQCHKGGIGGDPLGSPRTVCGDCRGGRWSFPSERGTQKRTFFEATSKCVFAAPGIGSILHEHEV